MSQLKKLASVPLSKIAHRFLFLGKDASKALLSKFIKVIKSIPNHILKSRLAVMSQQTLPSETLVYPLFIFKRFQIHLYHPEKAESFVLYLEILSTSKLMGLTFYYKQNRKSLHKQLLKPQY